MLSDKTAKEFTEILVLYDSNGGNTYRMAQLICRGIASEPHCKSVLRTVEKAGSRSSDRLPPVPETGAPFVELDDLNRCDGLIIGSPTHFGNMSASLKLFWDQTTTQWFAGSLTGKPAACFTSTGSMHGGQEMTLHSMMIPLLHHGMLICGLPYSHPELMKTPRGGTPYGASHVSGEDGQATIQRDEETLCKALGKRVAHLAHTLRLAP